MTGLNYKGAGVDIDAGAALVEAIKPLARSTRRRGVASDLGSFGALFDLKAAGYTDPILVATTDGVGTKLKVAIAVGKHDTVGIDLVAMCVNDLVVQGAEPLFFLDYYATGKLSVDLGREILVGITDGCRQAGCALIGGETAEMPGFYAAGDYDLAGFALGAVERGGVITGERASEGDRILGLASTGLHSNGFSLVRKVIELAGLSFFDPAPFAPAKPLGLALLAPTRIYAKSCLAAIRVGGVRAMAHITGGGLIENLPRVLSSDLAAEIDATAWTLPEVFRWLTALGGISAYEMARTFNCGIGMAVITAAEQAEEIKAVLEQAGETVFRIGRLVTRVPGEPQVVIAGAEGSWPS